MLTYVDQYLKALLYDWIVFLLLGTRISQTSSTNKPLMCGITILPLECLTDVQRRMHRFENYLSESREKLSV